MKYTALILGIFIAIVTSFPADDNNDTNSELFQAINYRLPTVITPTNYDIDLTPYFEDEGGKLKFTFDGSCVITLRTNESNIDQIVLHAKDLDIPNNGGIRLTEAIDKSVNTKIIKREQDDVTNKLTLKLEYPLKANMLYKLTFTYSGHLGQDMHGFYVSSYVENGIVKYIGTTQFEQTHARRAFPCFDEPRFKATFTIKITRPKNYAESVSNTKIVRKEENVAPNRIRETFATTPRMSTYLVAFIVSEFKIRENAMKTFGVLSRPEAYSQTEYAFEIGQKQLPEFDKWTAYRYHSVPEMTKMHMAALPDFSAGAMENWGLLTYRETALLYDPTESTASAQQRVGTVIAHEQAHMWFGNLVTCEWWSYTWLNEGFARFFQYFMGNMVHESWELNLQIVPEQIHTAFAIDADDSMHALNHDVNSPAEVAGIFNSISYNKGASIVRMIQHLMGFPDFQSAMMHYLKENEFGLSTPEKLLKSLQLKTNDNLNMAAIIDTWTYQAGFPLVRVDRHENKKTLVISQNRFWIKNRNDNDKTLWEIPLNFASPTDNQNFLDTRPLFTLGRQERQKEIELNNETEWLILNVQQTGYYRVNYDDQTWLAIGSALQKSNHSGIHVLNRAQIVDDLFNLARAQYTDYNLAMSIIQYIEKEEHYIPWLSAFNNFAFLLRRLTGDDLSLLKNYIISLTENVYKKLGFEEKNTDSRLDIYNRANILSHVCKFGQKDCVEQAKKQFDLFETTGQRISVNLRPAVYCTGIAEGDNSEWDFLWNRFLKENVAAEQVVILNALGCTRNKDILLKYLNFILTDSVRLQDKLAAVTATYSQQESNIDTVLDFIIANHKEVKDSFGTVGDVEKILSSIAVRFTSDNQLSKLEKFYNDNRGQLGLTETIPKALSNAKYDLQWSKDHAPGLIKYIKSVNGASSTISSISLVLSVFSILYIFLS